MWKKQKQTQINDRPLKYPTWTFVQVGYKYYLILSETMLEFISERAFLSWNVKPILTTEIAISHYKPWKKIGFAPGSKVRTLSGEKYIMSGTHPIEAEACRVATPDLFRIGFDERDFILISDVELKFHKRGGDILGIE